VSIKNSNYNSRFYFFVVAFIVTSLLSSVSEASKRERSEKKSGDDSRNLWIMHTGNIEDEPFESENLDIERSVYIPDTSLVLGEGSVRNWAQRISYPFQMQSGNDVILHFETRYSKKKWEKLAPAYAMQLNLEIPQSLFHNRSDVDLKNLKGFLAWSHPNFGEGDFYEEPFEGHLKIWKVKKGVLKGYVNFKFRNNDKIVHIYGRVQSQFKSRDSYLNEQASARQKLYDEAKELGDNF